MANPRYGKQVAQSRGADVGTGGGKAKGFSASVTVKQAFTKGQLPGKASNWYGVKGPVVSKYPSSKGCC